MVVMLNVQVRLFKLSVGYLKRLSTDNKSAVVCPLHVRGELKCEQQAPVSLDYCSVCSFVLSGYAIQ